MTDIRCVKGGNFVFSQPTQHRRVHLSGLGLKSQVQLAASREQRQLFHRWQYNAAACRDSANSASYKRLAAGRPADHRMSISLTNGRKLGAYITSTNCTCTDARRWWSRLKLRTSAPGLSHSEEPRADHSVTARSRSWSGNNVRRVGRNSPPRLDRRLEHEPTRDTAHGLSSRFGGFWNAPPREVSAPPVFATARRIWIDS